MIRDAVSFSSRSGITLSFMVPKAPLGAALMIVTVVLAYSAFGSMLLAEDFDQPLRKTVVDLGPSVHIMPGSSSPVLLSCYYYQGFMVKELDDPGLKGAPWVTITPIPNGEASPCRRSHGARERFMAKGWWGFIGVKGRLFFLEAADGEDDGMAVRILDLKTVGRFSRIQYLYRISELTWHRLRTAGCR